MKKFTTKSTTSLVSKILTAGVVVAACAVQNASAGLVWDLRVTSKNGNAVGVGETKNIFGDVGDVFEIGMWAIVTGAPGNGAAEGMQSGLGKTISTHSGTFRGNQSAPVLESLFVNPTAALPTIQDLNSDGFNDLGSTTFTAVNTTGGNWFARSSLSPGFQTTGTPVTDGTEFKLFRFNYTVAAGSLTGSASIQWTQQVTGTINSASYSMDGSVAATTSKNINLGGTSLGAAIIITAIPEPSAFGMVLVGALGLVGFRRLGFRRNA